MLNKIWARFRGICLAIVFRIIFNKRCCITFVNVIRGSFHLFVEKNSRVIFGTKLMTQGPAYFSVLGNGKLSIGEHVFFNHNCSITCMQEIIIGDNCKIANNVVIVDHDHDMINGDYKKSPIHIGDNVWICANCVILRGVTIGSNSIIAAGSIVNRDIEAGSLVAGVPARKIKNIR